LIIKRVVRVQRMTRFYYEIDVQFILVAKQLENVLNELIKMI